MVTVTQCADEVEALGDDPAVEDVERFLLSFEAHHTLEFILTLTVLVEKKPGVAGALEEILESDAPADARYAAFYGLGIHYRRRKLISQYGTHVERYGDEFSDRALCEFLHAIFLRERGDRSDFRPAIEMMERVADEVPDNPAVHKGLANTYVTAVEREIHVEPRDTLLRKARERIRRAIDLWPDYGEYYVDLGRVYAQEGDYERAEQEIRTGIDKENPEKDNYPIRIADYQYYLSQVQVRKAKAEANDEFDRLRDELESLEDFSDDIVRDFHTTVLQTLGFFAGIITLIVTTVQIGSTFSATQAGQLILLLTGGLVVAFSSLSLLLPTSPDPTKSAAAFGSGAGLVVLAIAYGAVV